MKSALICTAMLLIAGDLSGIWIFGKRGHTPHSKYARFVYVDVEPENVDTQLPETQHSDPEAFYQTIIDSNIFRPLNWEPPHRESDYRLLGTILAADGHQGTAYIQDLKSETLNTVSVGQKIGTMTVKFITPKQVTLTQNGKTLILSMRNSPFLNSRNTRSMPPPITTAGPRKDETHTITRTTGKQQYAPSEWKKHLQEKAAKIRAERKRLTEYLQQHQGMSGKQTLYEK